jgi:hypothetical protein
MVRIRPTGNEQWLDYPVTDAIISVPLRIVPAIQENV